MSQEPPKVPDSPTESVKSAPQSSAAPTRSRQQAVLRLLWQAGEIVLALVPVVLNGLRQLWQLTLALLKWVWQTWMVLLPKVRAVLPAPWNTKLPDQVLTASAALLLALLLWLPITILSHRPSAAKTTNQPVQTARRDQVNSALEPAPDLNRIAAIQDQLAEVTAEYADGLIQAVRANFTRENLTVTVNNDWYTLSDLQRNQLANELLKRSKKLAFDQLEIVDLEGTLLARSPVVGTNMVILASSREAA
jgi:hypothetical protein